MAFHIIQLQINIYEYSHVFWHIYEYIEKEKARKKEKEWVYKVL